MTLEAHSISYRIAGSQILDNISVKLEPGKLSAILGPNGAGKSTLLAALCGQIKPSGGAVWLNGKLLGGYRQAELARFRAVMAQDNSIAFDYHVQDVVELGRYPHRLRPSSDETAIVQAAMLAADISHLAKRNFNTLSGGEKARCQLARVLAQIWESPSLHSPNHPQRWLLLDEPTAALDLSHQHSVMRTVKAWAAQRGIGVVAIVHDINLALRYADMALVMQSGRVAGYGRCTSLLTPELTAQVWGVECHSIGTADGCPYMVVH
jgi:iron complex transport system ATP-binding protein